MPTVEIRIPQLGEGLVEVRIVALLKQPGDAIRRDEPIYTMETDKAEVEIESPVDGTLEAWAVEEEAIVPVGEVVARVAVEAEEAAGAPAVPHAPSNGEGEGEAAEEPRPTELRNAKIPPRTRSHAKKAGVSEQELLQIPAASGKLMPEDVDRYLAARDGARAKPVSNGEYEEVPMSARQRTLFYRLTSGASQVVAGTIEEPIRWEPVERVNQWFKQQGLAEGDTPTRFLLVAWCAAQAIGRDERFRSTIVDVNTLRRYHHGNLGIAVALPHDELTSAVVPGADALSFEQFVQTARERIRSARDGLDQASKAVAHVSLTGMASSGVRTAVPVVVPPAVATLFVGAPYDSVEPDEAGGMRFVRLAHLALTFDHRIINGVGAASFLNDVKERIAGLPAEFGVEGG